MSAKVPAGSTIADVDVKGAFMRRESAFRNKIEKGGAYPPMERRYILYISYACPWASRCTAFRVIKGLEHVIELAVVSPVWGFTRPGVDDHEGWLFDPSFPDATPDPLGQFQTVRDIYDLSMKNTGDSFETRYTVPVLFDRESMSIVNNESSEIIRMFNDSFNDFAKHPTTNLSPVALLPAIDAMNEKTYEPICNGVYKCGFAQSQEAYDEAVGVLFQALAEVEAHLSTHRYLVGSVITEADIRLFCCLVRFDEVYSVHFKCNAKLIREQPNILQWMRDIYQTCKLTPTVNMLHIKHHYYRSHGSINPFRIVPVGSHFMSLLDMPYTRGTE